MESAHAVPDLTVIIPAYNEAKRLPRTLAATVAYLAERGLRYEILVVDDGSSDTTAEIAEKWAVENQTVIAQTDSALRVLRYDANRGKGYAVRYGVLRASGATILFMDADLATPIAELEKLEAALREYTQKKGKESAIAIGSRPLPESELLVRQPLYRELLGKGFNKLVQAVAAPGIDDTQCGFKLFPNSVGQAIFSRAVMDGFSFDVEMIFIARKLGYTVLEIPVRWAHQEGAAAFDSKRAYILHGLRMVRDLPRIRWAHRAVHPIGRTSATRSLS